MNMIFRQRQATFDHPVQYFPCFRYKIRIFKLFNSIRHSPSYRKLFSLWFKTLPSFQTQNQKIKQFTNRNNFRENFQPARFIYWKYHVLLNTVSPKLRFKNRYFRIFCSFFLPLAQLKWRSSFVVATMRVSVTAVRSVHAFHINNCDICHTWRESVVTLLKWRGYTRMKTQLICDIRAQYEKEETAGTRAIICVFARLTCRDNEMLSSSTGKILFVCSTDSTLMDKSPSVPFVPVQYRLRSDNLNVFIVL